MSESYRDPCPHCETRLLGVSRKEYIQHLKDEHTSYHVKVELQRDETCGGTSTLDLERDSLKSMKEKGCRFEGEKERLTRNLSRSS